MVTKLLRGTYVIIMVVRRLFAYFPFLLFFMASLSWPLQAQERKYEGLMVRNIQFNPPPPEQPIDDCELHEILPLQMHQPLKMSDVRASIERLFATGRYVDIQVDAQPYR